MRLALLSLVAAAAAVSPALANEARFEGRGGVIWSGGNSEGIAGVAAGYDWDLGDNAFAGLEVSGDKILESNTRVSLGVGGRVGAKLGEAGKLYVVSTYQTKPCKFCEESVSAGAGYQHAFGESLYGKIEVRHNFVGNGVKDSNTVAVGIGTKF
jgi:outer membrane immunogenic protein